MSSLVEKPLRKYEGIIILHPDLSEADQKAFFKRNAETIQQYQGRVHHVDIWGKRRLANPIKKLKLGTYFHTTFEAKAEAVAEIERLLGIDDRVLRFMHTRLDDRKSLAQHVEEYKNLLVESNKREQEKEAKRDARRQATAGAVRDRSTRRREDEGIEDVEGLSEQ